MNSRNRPVGILWGSTRPSAPGCRQFLVQNEYRMWNEGIQSSPTEKDLGVLWMRGWAWPSNVYSHPWKPIVSWAASKEWPAGLVRWFSTSALVRLNHPALESLAQEGWTWTSWSDQMARAPLLWREAERVGVVQPVDEKALGRPYSCLSVLEEGLLEKLGQVLHQGC